ncbi:MAG TPA: 6-carboxytetrahydropterin synthase [Thermoanaerobaculia bacterium]|jgi:6-pyruvoyltetrahydropterin/6-carboxytetrahydropterin synthase|nr:6-carboxytetrahydropterin synthase [Thermoanaerobaculia bacterium]
MPRYELLVRARFEAAHHLTAYRGAPEPVHGHSWQVEARIVSSELGPEGYAVDFVEIQGRLEALVARFRHGDINTVPPFDRSSPTAERLAEWFHRELATWLDGHRSVGGASRAQVSSVSVWEGPDCSATFIGDSS